MPRYVFAATDATVHPPRDDGPGHGEHEGSPPFVGRGDGHGQYGVLDEDADGLLCHACGWRGPHLGLHAHRAHGMTAWQYKLEHGLRRSKGLVVAALRAKLVDRSSAQLATRSVFLARRDTRKATAARLAFGAPLSPAGAAASAAAAGQHRGSRRIGIVVTCAECSVEFCPLRGASKRRFCTRSCASRYNRRQSYRRKSAPTTEASDGSVLESTPAVLVRGAAGGAR